MGSQSAILVLCPIVLSFAYFLINKYIFQLSEEETKDFAGNSLLDLLQNTSMVVSAVSEAPGSSMNTKNAELQDEYDSYEKISCIKCNQPHCNSLTKCHNAIMVI